MPHNGYPGSLVFLECLLFVIGWMASPSQTKAALPPAISNGQPPREYSPTGQEQTPSAPEGHWSAHAYTSNIAVDPACDFDARVCKIAEEQRLLFDLHFSGLPGVPFCLFADPRTLPAGAVFPPKYGMGKLVGTFDWTPHECQAGEYIVHFHVSFYCFDLFFASLLPMTITVSEAVSCGEIGTCCLPDGTCVEMTSEECKARGGEFQGPSATCPTSVAAGPAIECPVKIGACCLPDGGCTQSTEKDCLHVQGIFLGDATGCASDACMGACCKNDFTCDDGLSQAQCELPPVEGTFRGPGTNCNDLPTTACGGACCFHDGSCFFRPHERDCRRRLGEFEGIGTRCATQGGTITCPVTGRSCCGTPSAACTTAEHPRCGLDGGTIVSPDPCPSATACPQATGACCLIELGSAPFCTNGSSKDLCTGPDTRYLGDGSKCGDDDGDGVDNCCDTCPNTPPGEPVRPCSIIDVLGISGCSCTERPGSCLDDGNACTRELCDPSDPEADGLGCVHRPIPGCCRTDADCDDNDACTSDTCFNGGCIRVTTSCDDDGIRCTVDRCHKQLGCNWPNHALCDDRNVCTVDFCDQTSGCRSAPKFCGDGFACTEDSCDQPTGDCKNDPRHERCDDLDPCTLDRCDPRHSQSGLNGCTNLRPSLAVTDVGRTGKTLDFDAPTANRVQIGDSECGDGDFNEDGRLDLNDLDGFVRCLDLGGPGSTVDTSCSVADLDGTAQVNLVDVHHYLKNPFVCNPQSCEDIIGGKCIPMCEPPEVCVPDGGASSLNEEAVATGVRRTCKRPCSSDVDCFVVGKCETCIEGLCQERCDPARCEKPCDGAGSCPSRCETNETCVDGICRRTCLGDRDCRPCESCREGVCNFACLEDQVCTFRGCGQPRCSGPADCPACHACVDGPSGSACLSCEQLGLSCPNERCRIPCEEANDCALCERCADGVCVNNCPAGQACDPARQECRGACTMDTDCPECNLCVDTAIVDPFCLSCEEYGNCLECNQAGRCQSKCDYNACDTCVDGICFYRCVDIVEACDGAGNCIQP